MSERPSSARHTRQQSEVRIALAGASGFRSAQQLHAHLRDRGIRIGLTTVYRILHSLADSGEIDVMRLPRGEQLFRRCHIDTHHHHLMCRRCGRAVEIQGMGVDAQAERLAAEYGFSDIAHAVEIFGTCSECMRNLPLDVLTREERETHAPYRQN